MRHLITALVALFLTTTVQAQEPSDTAKVAGVCAAVYAIGANQAEIREGQESEQFQDLVEDWAWWREILVEIGYTQNAADNFIIAIHNVMVEKINTGQIVWQDLIDTANECVTIRQKAAGWSES